ncbi:MgtC/SapB family protein [Paraburkholderia tagetis]|uniref:DUF4010 domain-containing protein n=1 Tax=Paraburkholderia tagetis TaxID=2913261 RepID=A0A9X1RVM0_9BURK|nr:DUF4010 domain-containing protein [Paraburkholderia tagetis]MCG5076956.1 DUF4010 domain-containing protein [Paraburkholderia tagetis]
MLLVTAEYMPFAVALGVGLLVGAERERRKGEGATRAAAGIRTFTVVALLGAIAMRVGGAILAATLVVALTALATAAYLRPHDDPGLTTEAAMIATLLLGALAVLDAPLAAALGVLLTIVLAARSPLHRFVTTRLSQREIIDLLTLAASALIILPVLPGHPVDPYGAINLQTVWRFAVLVMTISAVGHIAQLVFGARIGLPFAGLLGGFVSSVATIASMGRRAAQAPGDCAQFAAAAVLSSVATLVQLSLVVGVVYEPLVRRMAPEFAVGALAALVYGLLAAWRAARKPLQETLVVGRAVDLKAAVLLASTLMVLMLAATLLARWLGKTGLLISAGLGGLIDTHSAAASIAALAAQSLLAQSDATLPIIVALTANSVTKCAVAVLFGKRVFAAMVVPGQVLILACVWSAWLIVD